MFSLTEQLRLSKWFLWIWLVIIAVEYKSNWPHLTNLLIKKFDIFRDIQHGLPKGGYHIWYSFSKAIVN